MALVILSMGRLSRTRVRTLSSRTLAIVAATSMLAVAVGAFALGVGVGRTAADTPSPVLSVDHPEGRFLVDRLGEISGKLVRLEQEALNLAQRVGVIKRGEPLSELPNVSAAGTASEQKSAGPRGGPMIPPLDPALEPAPASAVFDDAVSGVTDLEYELERLGSVLFEIERATTELDLALMAYPNRNPVPNGRRNSSFGNRIDPFNGRRAFHSGMDFQAPAGTPVLASAGGRVSFAGYHREYGYMIEIDHGNSLVTRYAHCSRLFVKKGDVVTPSQRIAAVGSTGRSTGAHLHFEVLRNGRFVNPSAYLSGAAPRRS